MRKLRYSTIKKIFQGHSTHKPGLTQAAWLKSLLSLLSFIPRGSFTPCERSCMWGHSWPFWRVATCASCRPGHPWAINTLRPQRMEAYAGFSRFVCLNTEPIQVTLLKLLKKKKPPHFWAQRFPLNPGTHPAPPHWEVDDRVRGHTQVHAHDVLCKRGPGRRNQRMN